VTTGPPKANQLGKKTPAGGEQHTFSADDIKVFGPFPAILCNDNAWTFDQGTPTHNSFMSILHRDWEIRLESAKCVREFVPVAWDVRHQSEHLNTPHD